MNKKGPLRAGLSMPSNHKEKNEATAKMLQV